MKKTKLFKTLLLAAGLLVGASAWAEKASLDPVGVFTWTNTPAITYDASATSWAINQGGITGGKIGKSAGPYAIVKFDASVISGKTLLSAKLDFDITAGEYNSSINIAQMSDASFDPATVTTESFDATATQFQAGDWSTKNTTTHFSYDVQERVKTNNVIAFAIYTYTAREQTLRNVKLNIEYSAVAVEKFEYELNAVDESDAKIKTLISGEEYEGKTVTAYFPYMFYEGGKLYTTASSPYSVSFDKDNKVKTVTYSEASSNIVAYKEGESVVTESGEDAVCSNGKWGHAAGGKTAVISTLPAGKYTATIYLKANGNRSIVLRNTENTDVATNVIASLPISKTSAAGVYTSDEFTITKTTSIGFSGYTTDKGSTNQSADIDYILITKTGEAPQYQFTAKYYNSEKWEDVYAYTFGDETLGAWPGTQLTATDGIYNVSFEAAAAPNNIIFNNGKDGDAKKQTADLAFENRAAYNFDGKGDIYSFTFTTNKGWNPVYAYAWSGEDASKVEQLGGWPGTVISGTGNTYSLTFVSSAEPEYIIFNGNSDDKKTDDLVFENGKTYSLNSSYVVAGTETLFGSDFNTTDENNKLDEIDNTLTLTEKELAVGIYKYKVVMDGNWSISYGDPNNSSDNYNMVIDIKMAGKYDIVITFDPITKAVAHTMAVYKGITDAGYATFCAPYDLNFAETGVTAYIAQKDANNNVTFEPVSSAPAETGLLLKGNEGTYKLKMEVSSQDCTDNILKGTLVSKEIPANSFVLMKGDWEGGKGVGFYRALNAFTVSANTAYIEALPTTARFIGFNLDESTGIDGIAVEKMSNGEVYNLQGQRVTKAQKGLYIINGKKVLVK